MGETIKVFVNGKEKIWPLDEYLDYKARQYGFDSYEDMQKAGYNLNIERK